MSIFYPTESPQSCLLVFYWLPRPHFSIYKIMSSVSWEVKQKISHLITRRSHPRRQTCPCGLGGRGILTLPWQSQGWHDVSQSWCPSSFMCKRADSLCLLVVVKVAVGLSHLKGSTCSPSRSWVGSCRVIGERWLVGGDYIGRKENGKREKILSSLLHLHTKYFYGKQLQIPACLLSNI